MHDIAPTSITMFGQKMNEIIPGPDLEQLRSADPAGALLTS
jgi:hypothetical protein